MRLKHFQNRLMPTSSFNNPTTPETHKLTLQYPINHKLITKSYNHQEHHKHVIKIQKEHIEVTVCIKIYMATRKQPKYEMYVRKQNPKTMEAEKMCSSDHSRNSGEECAVQR